MALAASVVMAFAPVRVREQSAAGGVGTGEVSPVVVLQDVSESLSEKEQSELAVAGDSLLNATGVKTALWMKFAGRAEASGKKEALDTGATDISGALLAASIHRPGAIVLLSDGLWNRGTDPVIVAREAGLPPIGAVYLKQEKAGQVGFAPPGYSSDNTAKTGVFAPEKVSAGEEFTVKVRLYSGSGGTLKMRLRGPVGGKSSEVPVAAEKSVDIDGSENVHERTVKLATSVQGTWLVEAEFFPRNVTVSGGVLSQTAVLHAAAGPLRAVFLQGRLGWDAAALLRLMEGREDVRLKKVRGYANKVDAPPEAGDIDVLVLCGFPRAGILPAWKAAMASYTDADKGVLFVGNADEYNSWANMTVAAVPRKTSEESSPPIVELNDIAVLSSEAGALLERKASFGAISQAQSVQVMEGAIPIVVGKKTGKVFGAMSEKHNSRAAWFSEPPFSTVFSRLETGNEGDARDVFLDLMYYLGHRKRRPDELTLMSQRPSAKPGETIVLVLDGLDVGKTNSVTLYTIGPEGEKTRRVAQDSLSREAAAGRVFFREKLQSPGLHLFRVSAGMNDGRTLWAGTACMVKGADVEKMEHGANEALLRKLAEETAGIAEGVTPGKGYSPSSEMVRIIKDAVSSGPTLGKVDKFEVYRWWPLLLMFFLAVFLEWAFRTR